MRLLLDTHALLWALADDPTLARDAQSAISDPGNWVAVSAVSGWEIETKRATGKLRAPENLVETVLATRFVQLPLTLEHGVAAGRLPRHHKDPFDRMLVAQAQLEGLTIVTRDPRFEPYSVAVLPA